MFFLQFPFDGQLSSADCFNTDLLKPVIVCQYTLLRSRNTEKTTIVHIYLEKYLQITTPQLHQD